MGLADRAGVSIVRRFLYSENLKRITERDCVPWLTL